jgi:hypothetical protein
METKLCIDCRHHKQLAVEPGHHCLVRKSLVTGESKPVDCEGMRAVDLNCYNNSVQFNDKCGPVGRFFEAKL